MKNNNYWSTNIKIIILCLSLWAFVSLGCGILWANWLNQFSLGGFKLGLWFAQQGSIIGFVVILFFYAMVMHRADKNILKK
jgi:putative solute:sodium symporter small subunit